MVKTVHKISLVLLAIVSVLVLGNLVFSYAHAQLPPCTPSNYPNCDPGTSPTSQQSANPGEYPIPANPGEEPLPANPGETEADADITIFDPIERSIEEIFIAILDIIMVFAVPIVVFFIIWAGFLYVTAQGNEEQLKKATKALTYAVIGGVIVLGAQAILAIITNTIELFN